MARPSKHTGYVADTICRAVSVGVTLPTAATIAGISASTVYAWRSRFPEFAQQLDQAHANAVGKAVQVLNESDSWEAAAWWLSRMCPAEFGPAEVA